MSSLTPTGKVVRPELLISDGQANREWKQFLRRNIIISGVLFALLAVLAVLVAPMFMLLVVLVAEVIAATLMTRADWKYELSRREQEARKARLREKLEIARTWQYPLATERMPILAPKTRVAQIRQRLRRGNDRVPAFFDIYFRPLNLELREPLFRRVKTSNLYRGDASVQTPCVSFPEALITWDGRVAEYGDVVVLHGVDLPDIPAWKTPEQRGLEEPYEWQVPAWALSSGR